MKKKKRITVVSVGSAKIPVDTEHDWQDFLTEGEHGRAKIAGNSWHFLIHLPHMDLPEPIKNKFWKEFDAAEHKKARTVALAGLTHSNHENEWNLALAAADFHRSLTSGKFEKKPADAAKHAVPLAVAFSEIVARLDAPAFRRLAAIMEARGMPDGLRGGIGSEDGYMLEKFAELHAATYSLPSKKQLREACGLNEESCKKLADKRMRKLGLFGLPAEPDL